MLLLWCRTISPDPVMPEFNVTQISSRIRGGGCALKNDFGWSTSSTPSDLCPHGQAAATAQGQGLPGLCGDHPCEQQVEAGVGPFLPLGTAAVMRSSTSIPHHIHSSVPVPSLVCPEVTKAGRGRERVIAGRQLAGDTALAASSVHARLLAVLPGDHSLPAHICCEDTGFVPLQPPLAMSHWHSRSRVMAPRCWHLPPTPLAAWWRGHTAEADPR